jgi:hypothetical protein
MTFIEWDPIVRACVFGAVFLGSLFGVLWVWYDTSGEAAPGRWTWRVAGSVLVSLTVPAVFLGAANLEDSREMLLNIFAWMGFAAGAAALLSVVSYAAWGRVAPGVDGGQTWKPLSDDLTEPQDNRRPVSPPMPPPPPQPRARPTEAYVLVKGGPDRGKQFPLYETVLVGRSRKDVGETGVAIEDRRISATHAQMKLTGGNFVFTDLNSTNGSFLIVEGREERIRSPQILVDGDEIRVGQSVIEFVDARNGRRR